MVSVSDNHSDSDLVTRMMNQTRRRMVFGPGQGPGRPNRTDSGTDSESDCHWHGAGTYPGVALAHQRLCVYKCAIARLGPCTGRTTERGPG